MRTIPIQLIALAASLSGCGGCQGSGDSGEPACEKREGHAHVLLEDVADATLPRDDWPFRDVGGVIGDVDGDGIGDIGLYQNKDIGSSWIFEEHILSGPIVGDMRQASPSAQILESGCSDSPYCERMGDLDDDGTSDLVCASACDLGDYFLVGPVEGLVDLAATHVAYPNVVNSYIFPNVGDLSGDGKDDIVVRRPDPDGGGGFSVLYSPADLPLDPSSADAAISIPGTVEAFSLGNECSPGDDACADLDGDGYTDLLVVLGLETEMWDPPITEAAILHGPLAGEIDLLDAADAVVTLSEASAMTLRTAGDLMGDGEPSLVADYGELYDQEGYIYVYAGPFAGVVTLDSAARIDAPYGEAGAFSIATDMDVNSDGVGDLLFNYVNDWDSGIGVGSPAYVFLGPLCGNMTYEDADIRLQPHTPDFVTDVAAAGDISGDGVDDVILSTADNDEWGDRYVLHGSADLMARMMAHD